MSEETSIKNVEAPKPPSAYKVLPSEFGLAEHQIRQHVATIRAGVPFSAVKDDPATWAHLASKLTDGDIIHIRTKDCAYYARLYVTRVHKQAAKTRVLEYHDFGDTNATIGPSEYMVEWAGAHKWRVVRSTDRTVIEYGFGTRTEADEHAKILTKQLAA